MPNPKSRMETTAQSSLAILIPEAEAHMENEHKKKQDYYKVLTAHIDTKKDMKRKGVGMSKSERQLNAKVLSKMELEMQY